MPNISDRKMDVGENFVGKKLGKKAFLAVLLAVYTHKNPHFLFPLKNYPKKDL